MPLSISQYITTMIQGTEITIISDSNLAVFQEVLINPYFKKKEICSKNNIWRLLPLDCNSIFGFIASYQCLL